MSTEQESNMEMINVESFTSVEEDHHDLEITTESKDYDSLSLEELIQEINLYKTEDQIIAERNQIEAIRKAFSENFNDTLSELDSENEDDLAKKDQLYAKKSVFDKTYFEIKTIQKKHFKDVENTLKKNLQERLDIIEELKNLIKPENQSNNKFNAFHSISERWKNAGPIPKDKYNHVWNNYRFHVENFFDYIHLDKEARDLEFKHNYDKKVELLNRLEALLQENDIKQALADIRLIQKVWREDIGPVERVKREELWTRFDALNEKVNERRKDLKALLSVNEKQNAEQKQAIISQIQELTLNTKNSVEFWNKQSEKLNELKENFIKIGRAPKDVSDQLWANFRNSLKQFNEQKNSYFKSLREEQNKNIEKKKALVAQAKALENSEDWAQATETVKRIQAEWKKIGHIPAKFSNSLWNEFKTACDHYFDRLHALKNAANEQEIKAFEQKSTLLKSLEKVKLNGDPKADIASIQTIIQEWNQIGRVPFAQKGIQEEFNKAIDGLYSKIKMDKKELELLQFKSSIERIVANGDTRKLNEEEIYISKKINEIKAEINQLENNILFINSGKKANPFLESIRKNIDTQKEILEKWKEKLKIVRSSRITE